MYIHTHTHMHSVCITNETQISSVDCTNVNLLVSVLHSSYYRRCYHRRRLGEECTEPLCIFLFDFLCIHNYFKIKSLKLECLEGLWKMQMFSPHVLSVKSGFLQVGFRHLYFSKLPLVVLTHSQVWGPAFILWAVAVSVTPLLVLIITAAVVGPFVPCTVGSALYPSSLFTESNHCYLFTANIKAPSPQWASYYLVTPEAQASRVLPSFCRDTCPILKRSLNCHGFWCGIISLTFLYNEREKRHLGIGWGWCCIWMYFMLLESSLLF